MYDTGYQLSNQYFITENGQYNVEKKKAIDCDRSVALKMALPTATHFDEDAVIDKQQERQELLHNTSKSPQHMSVDAYEH